ncbi:MULTISPECIES: ectoine hydroxylase [unclassified Halomonas]|uniref:ectoine hydroxylase n=1 Tax=unclassified Halomonas TaxID=2609666 RepID=UPI00288385DD|nr:MULTISPECIES: ectoine hydroxylase [unclassified Halomonas]MDT0500791.1 ectoine hydroxylase [Halomonas sp. PAR7]MDT0513019.1 ectoine hydroxylase [Halomonas sp. LES1]MDT0591570.1 ectoine hydroxylase [Halomonas sp. PAR8]
MRDMQDLFPTRLERKLGMFERIDPVVHSDDGQRVSGPLSQEELDEFEVNGFLSFENFFDREEMQAFIQELREYEEDEDLKLSEGAVLEPGKQEIRSIFGIHTISERFSRLTRDPRLLAMVQQILGSDVYIHQSRINYKPGFKGKGFNWHSDFETWHSEDGMPRMRSLSCSIILTDNGEFNGPLMLIPGSHKYFIPCVGRTPENNYKESLKSQEIGVPDAASLKTMMVENGIEAPKGDSGSLVMFECNTLHGSNINMSCWPRSNLFFVYNSVENTLHDPYCGNKPRPEFLAARKDWEPLKPVSDSNRS